MTSKTSTSTSSPKRNFKIAFFDTKSYMQQSFSQHAQHPSQQLELLFDWIDVRLNERTVKYAAGADAVCIFVNDRVDVRVAEQLHQMNIHLIALRCAGYNNVDLQACDRLGITVVRVPAYSPHAVAEHAIALILTLNRKIHHAYNRVRDQNFSLDRLVGFDMYGKTLGVVGTGKIGQCLVDIGVGFGMKIKCFDVYQQPHIAAKHNVQYVSLDELFATSDIISLHVPLLKSTHHLVNERTIAQMKRGVYLVNTSRGELIDTGALIGGLKSQHIGGCCLDVYEHESEIFYEDYSQLFIEDDQLLTLVNLPNVIVTSHQAFLTVEALTAIAKTTAKNVESVVIEGKRMKKANNSVNEANEPTASRTSQQQQQHLTMNRTNSFPFSLQQQQLTTSTNQQRPFQSLGEAISPVNRSALSIVSSL